MAKRSQQESGEERVTVQIRHIDSKYQIADILTKGNFMRYEWNYLLRLFNIIHFSSFLHQKFQLDWLHHDGEKNSATKRRKSCVQVATSSDECFFLCRRVPLPLQVRLHRKVRWCLDFQGNPVAGWILQQVHSTQLRRLKWDWRMHTLAGWRKSSRVTCRMRKKKLMILVLSRGITSLLRKLFEACGTTCRRNSRIHLESVSEKSKLWRATLEHF